MMKNNRMSTIHEHFKKNLTQLVKEDFEQCLEIANFVPIYFGSRFGGKSIYYHHKALHEAENCFLKESHIDAIYKVLDAWGMNSRTKLPPYDECFKGELDKYKYKSVTSEYKKRSIVELEDNEIVKIINWMFGNEIKGRNVRKDRITGEKTDKPTNTQIVLLSKTFHHILPNIIPPIDRQYSLRFMMLPYDDERFTTTGINLQNLDEKELARIFIEGMRGFFIENKTVLSRVQKALVKPNLKANIVGVFNTSLPKIFDNLIVAFGLLHGVWHSVQMEG